MHLAYLEDSKGDIVETVPFCSDSCHASWGMKKGNSYGGWNGCHETETDESCETCGDIIEGFQEGGE